MEQATAGDASANRSRPGFWNQKERAKWDAWNEREGMSADDAKRQYSEAVKRLKKEHG